MYFFTFLIRAIYSASGRHYLSEACTAAEGRPSLVVIHSAALILNPVYLRHAGMLRLSAVLLPLLGSAAILNLTHTPKESIYALVTLMFAMLHMLISLKLLDKSSFGLLKGKISYRRFAIHHLLHVLPIVIVCWLTPGFFVLAPALSLLYYFVYISSTLRVMIDSTVYHFRHDIWPNLSWHERTYFASWFDQYFLRQINCT